MLRNALMAILVGSLLHTGPALAADVEITPDVVYGHKLGLAMTFDVFRPKENANGAATLFMVSGGWYSGWAPPESLLGRFKPLTDKGFTVFAVRHGSSPRFTIPEAVADVRRSVRFIRANAERFQIDPDRIGVFGASAGGHLSLMLGTTADEGEPTNKDPVERVSNRVQAVVAWVAPTDLQIMVWEAPGRLPAYLNYPALNLEVAKAKNYSPLEMVTADDAPTLLVVGDKDELVPMSHSQNIQEAFEKAGVESELVVLEGAGHGFGGQHAQRAADDLVGWFEKHLLAK